MSDLPKCSKHGRTLTMTGGHITSRLICEECEKPSTTPEPYATLAELEAALRDPLTVGLHARLLATARSGLEDRERLDWLERTLHSGDTDNYGVYDQAAGCWFVGEPPIRVASLRAAIDKGRTMRSGRASPNGGENG